LKKWLCIERLHDVSPLAQLFMFVCFCFRWKCATMTEATRGNLNICCKSCVKTQARQLCHTLDELLPIFPVVSCKIFDLFISNKQKKKRKEKKENNTTKKKPFCRKLPSANMVNDVSELFEKCKQFKQDRIKPAAKFPLQWTLLLNGLQHIRDVGQFIFGHCVCSNQK
jgi:hypothetical protein